MGKEGKMKEWSKGPIGTLRADPNPQMTNFGTTCFEIIKLSKTRPPCRIPQEFIYLVTIK
jgi:hypothetical protein